MDMSAQTHKVGVHFKALYESIFRAPLRIITKFFFAFWVPLPDYDKGQGWPETTTLLCRGYQLKYHPVSEIGQLKISVIRHTIKNTYCSGFVVYLRTSLTWPRDKLLFRFKRVHSGAGRWNLSWEMGELEFCAHNSVPSADLKSNAELWLALPLCAQFFWPMRN